MVDILREATPFNSALETGLRALAILTEAYPTAYDLQRLLFFDYLVVHSQDADGPESLHPSTPLRNGELLVRRGIIERGLLLLISRRLVERHTNAAGISYSATDEADPFLDCLQTRYTKMLRERAQWAVEAFGELNDDEMKSYFDAHFERWTLRIPGRENAPGASIVSGFQLRALRVTGPSKIDAEISFGVGLNVISGPSDTGKSYIVEAIDFMLGGATPPRQIPESAGYDQAHLTIEAEDGRRFTITRALQGGDFLLASDTEPEAEPKTLGSRHSATDEDNISTFLLRLVGLDQKRLRKNVNNELQNLSFRNLAHLVIVDEESIIKKGSPIFTGELTQRTMQSSVFRLLITGLDDSSLIAVKKRAIAKAEIESQIVLLDQLISDYETDLKELTEDPENLSDQVTRLEAAILASQEALTAERAVFEDQQRARRDAWIERERIDSRRSEIDGLAERFALLDQSYGSDLERLEAIAEAGQFFVVLQPGPCPLCGAMAGDHQHDGLPHDGDIEALRVACESEITKIRQLRRELTDAVADLRTERTYLDAGGVRARTSYDTADALVRETLAPALSAARAEHGALLEMRAQVRQAQSLADRINALRSKRAESEAALGSAGRVTDERPGLPAASVQAFSNAVEAFLDAWSFPHEKPVYFEEREQDMVLGNRRRGEQGKGLRALTHAAFTTGFQAAIAALGRSPIGFVVLDSPLVTFREADHEESELGPDQKVAVKQAFYHDLASRRAQSQIIVLENEDPDEAIRADIVMHFFSKQQSFGRYGFFPVVAHEINE